MMLVLPVLGWISDSVGRKPVMVRPFAVAQAIFGGNAEMAVRSFKKADLESGYNWLAAAMFAVGFCVSIAMRDTQKYSPISDA